MNAFKRNGLSLSSCSLLVVVDRLTNIFSTTWMVTQAVEMSKEKGLHLDSPFNRICMSSELNFYELKFP